MTSAALPPVPDGGEPADYLSAAQFGNLDLWCAFRPLNDRGNGARLVERNRESLRWVPEHGWYAWDGKRWSRGDGEALARQAAHRMLAELRHEAEAVTKDRPEMKDRAGKLLAWAAAAGSTGRLSGALTEAKPYLQASVGDFDRHPDDVVCANGTVRLGREVTFQARRYEAGRLGTRLAAADYDPEHGCGRWLDFLADVQPNPAIREFLQRWWGYSITGHVSEQVLVLHYGTGANGKSTALDIISAVIGDYASILPFEALLEDKFKRGGEATPDIARLPGARFVISTEPDPGRSLAESQIKRLTGETTLMARALRAEFFEFRPQFKLNLAANKKPRVRGQDHGTWRRILLAPWKTRIEAPVRDLSRRIIEEEAPGVLAWLVEGARLWHHGGLKVPPEIQSETAIYRGDNDPVGRFLAAATVRVSGGKVPAKTLYEGYEVWARANGDEPISRRAFGVGMTDHGVERGKDSVVTYLGLRLRGLEAGTEVSA